MAHETTDEIRKRRQRAEYVARINRVLDHVEANIDGQLTLDQLARVANFSRYHFHRVFHAMVGETLGQYIQRVRAEKAALLLVANPERPITDVALDCGYSGSATFARSFREAFGMSASEWRDGGHLEYRKNRKQNRKHGQPMSNHGQEEVRWSVHVDGVANNPRWRAEMSKENGKELKADIEVLELPELNVAYVRHVGPYAGQAEVFEGMFNKLMGWAGPRGLLANQDLKILCVYHDDPEITDEAKLRADACVTVPDGTEVGGEVGSMKVPGGKFAVGHFELSNDQYPDAWSAIMGGWLPQSGYQPDDRLCYERYLNDPKQHPEGKCVVDICVPVKPL